MNLEELGDSIRNLHSTTTVQSDSDLLSDLLLRVNFCQKPSMLLCKYQQLSLSKMALFTTLKTIITQLIWESTSTKMAILIVLQLLGSLLDYSNSNYTHTFTQKKRLRSYTKSILRFKQTSCWNAMDYKNATQQKQLN